MPETSVPKAARVANPIVVLHHPLDQAGCSAPHTRCDGEAVSDFGTAHSLWMSRARLGNGARLQWDGEQNAEVIHVLSGTLRFGTLECSAGGSVYVPEGGAVAARAEGEVDILHYGSFCKGQDPARTELFAMAAREAHRFVSHGPDGRIFELDFFTDGTDPRTPLALFNVAVDGESYAPPHSHSVDEIIHILAGEIRVGTIRIGAGSSIGIAHGIRYSFRSESPVRFVNFRNGDAWITVRKGQTSHETMAARRAAGAQAHLS